MQSVRVTEKVESATVYMRFYKVLPEIEIYVEVITSRYVAALIVIPFINVAVSVIVYIPEYPGLFVWTYKLKLLYVVNATGYPVTLYVNP